MELTPSQSTVLDVLRDALANAQLARAVYCSEWLGYLPFGAYGWIEVDGADVSARFPSGWGQGDLEALVQAGLLRRESEWHNPGDEFESRIVYALIEGK